MPPKGDKNSVTVLLLRASAGDVGCLQQLLPLVYADLRAICARQLARERSDHTLQPTALVHEAYLRLVRQEAQGWTSRAHFFAVSSRVIRNILVDHARAKRAQKRDQGAEPPEQRTWVSSGDGTTDLLDLDEALSRLAVLDPDAAKVVEMRFFAGLAVREVAEVLQVQERAVSKHWSYASAWLRRELSRGL
ncbi:MAG: sigma-70 family RNA polymerase sigma factor [Planctomycetes bacterium]|nr:sigma-70 family RNA polymerase sigma factor [Planctomycetota bacterium]MCB9910118.1 sigma-70 family RNA polymerase sigma factor [Planctomycetota bacterium]MCB9913115.1 sigma-70 family RNA polymerase sigma factor [Planctomycetota bacterium]HPF14197.1 ECF-type sigma factor [Planctomycetota bacterium]HRV82359.1 ECF-type sigma factor [Planctomycetota bacterium]